MNKTLIFTNWSSWCNLDPKFRDGIAWKKESYPGYKNPIVKCKIEADKPAELIDVDNFEQGGVYLIYDYIQGGRFKGLIPQISKGEVIVLRHSKTPDQIISELSVLKNEVNPLLVIREGLHEDDRDALYRPVFEILNDSAVDKGGRIVKLLWPTDKEKMMETAIRFLMGCMKPYNEDTFFLTSYEDLCKAPGINESVRKFYEKVYPNAQKKDENPKRGLNDYKAQLAELRDKLIVI